MDESSASGSDVMAGGGGPEFVMEERMGSTIE